MVTCQPVRLNKMRSAVGFFVDLVVRGRLLGVGVGSSPQEVAAALGPDFVDDDQDWFTRRDYGLVEFTFLRERSYSCGFLIVEVHRLCSMGTTIVPPAIIDRYGPIPVRLAAAPLLRGAASAGCEMRPTGEQDTTDEVYVAARTGCLIHVVAGSAGPGGACPDDGRWPQPGEVSVIELHDPASEWWTRLYRRSG
jgi:hypothetical protein